jgi:hypothetical protein
MFLLPCGEKVPAVRMRGVAEFAQHAHTATRNMSSA